MSNKIWVGFIFIFFGFGFLLQQAGIWDFSDILAMFWPLILILIGVIQLTIRSISSFSGILFIAIGGLFLANQWVDVNIVTYLWPLLLIIVGLTILISRMKQDRTPHSDQSIRAFTLFSGSDIRSQSKDFTGGNVTSIFGGAEIDLRDAVLSKKGTSLEITTIFGGVSVYIPENVRVEITGVPIFGGWENKTRRQSHEDEELPVLNVHCLTVFGGAEFYN